MPLSKHMPRETEDLRVFVEFAPVAMAMLDRDLRYLCASRRWRQGGANPDEPIVGKTHQEVFPDTPQQFYAVYARCLQGEIAGSQREVITHNGQTIYLRWEARPWHLPDGTIGGLMLFSENLTPQVLAEERARQSAELLQHFFTHSPLSMGVFEIDGDQLRYVQVNNRSAIHLGCQRPEEVIGKTPVQLGRNPSGMVLWLTHARRALAENGPVSFEHALATGQILSVHLNPTPSPSAALPRCSYIVRDITDERRALADSEERLEFALEATNDGVWDWDLTTGRLQSSPRLARLLGYELEEMIETVEFARSITLPQDVEQVDRALADLVEGRAPRFDLEFRMTHKSGRTLWIHGRATIVKRDAHGKPVRIVGASRDITRRKTQEEQLRSAAQALAQSEERLEFALDATNEGVWDWDLVSGNLSSSPRIAQQLGMTPDQPTPSLEFWMAQIHPDDKPMNLQKINDLLEGRALDFESEYRLRHADGSYVWFLTRSKVVKRSPDGKPLRIVGTQVDITPRKAREEELRHAAQALAESKELLAFALEAANEGVWDWDLATGKLISSPHAADQLGLQPEDLGDTFEFWQQRMHPYEIPQTLRILSDYLEGRSPILAAEIRVRHKDGHWVWTELRGKVVKRAEGGRPLRLVGTHLDISQRKLQQEELRTAKEAAQAASQAKSEFLANISHEIRTPLSAILGSASVLEEGDLSAEKRAHFLEVVRRSGTRLMTLINSILDFSKVEAGKTEVERLPCDVPELAGDAAFFLRDRAKAKSIRFTLDCPPNLRLFTDPTRLSQILSNLLDNAIKFTAPGGSVWLHIREENAPLYSPRIRFDVRDTGVGISGEQRARLFEPFVQADSSTTRRFGGTGLGLAISRRLARILGGDIEVDSTPNVGSRFTLWLPLDLPQPQGPPKPAAAPAAQRPLNARVLLVEDGEDIQMLLAHVLERAGASLALATDGAQGVAEALAAHRAGRDYDLILMDIQMPGMDGNAAAAEMRKLGIKTPIVALTAAGMEINRRQALAAGCDDFLVKPFNTDRLLEVLRIWTDKPAQVTAAAARHVITRNV